MRGVGQLVVIGKVICKFDMQNDGDIIIFNSVPNNSVHYIGASKTFVIERVQIALHRIVPVRYSINRCSFSQFFQGGNFSLIDINHQFLSVFDTLLVFNKKIPQSPFLLENEIPSKIYEEDTENSKECIDDRSEKRADEFVEKWEIIEKAERVNTPSMEDAPEIIDAGKENARICEVKLVEMTEQRTFINEDDKTENIEEKEKTQNYTALLDCNDNDEIDKVK